MTYKGNVMRKVSGVIFFLFFSVVSIKAQVTVSPAFPTADQPITITYDATQGASNLIGVSRVKIHSGVILSGPTGTAWSHVIGTWGNPDSPGEMTSLGNNKWSITFTPRTYYATAGLPAGATVYRLGMVFREPGPCGGFGGATAECKKGAATGGGDIYVDLFQDGFSLSVTSPTTFPLFVTSGSQLTISAQTTENAEITVSINGGIKSTTAAATSITYNHTVTESGNVNVVVKADNGTEVLESAFTYVVRATLNQSRPPGIIDGINYSADQTKVTLSLWAPDKTSVYTFGDFSDWEIDAAYQMKKDGEHFWIEIAGLTAGTEYGFQYLVDEEVKMADPYADKILDPQDSGIPAGTYPNLKPYPSKALNNEWYFNRVSVFQTGQQPYSWVVGNFIKPSKEKLVVYELLVRDYFANGQRNYNNLIDTLSYLKRLGVNAIQLMPVMEFNGNESWGYNPAFMLAPDKYYGTKNKFKEFVDQCHQQGIAVILDIALNHQDVPNPYAMMDFNFTTFKPNPTNKWFNVSDRHPYGVFFDMNHESSYTKAYVDTITHYWLNEFKVDGYRFDLSKGFTQNDKCGGSTSNEGCFAQYDVSRIAILKRMADKIWSHTPQAYVILEHFADNAEEKELAEYRSGEGKGMMLWGNLNHAYAQNSMGFASGSDISWIHYGTRGWSVPHVVGYMESHDEERMMYRNITFGASASGYNVRTLSTALERAKSAGAFFFTLPGPKMIWQFEELGYDISIDFNGRTGNKPVHWEYKENPQRARLFETFVSLIRIRNQYDVFQTSDVSIQGGSNLVKQIILKNSPYNAAPTSTDDMNVIVIGNFDVTAKTVSANFPHTGTWYNYFALGSSFNVASAPMSILLQPGEFRLYTDVVLPAPLAELQGFLPPVAPVLTSADYENESVSLTWIDNSSLETEYRVYRRKSGEPAFKLVKTVSQNATSYTDDSGFESLTEYQYFVEAYNIYGVSASGIMDVTSDEIITGIENDVLTGIVLYPNPSTGSFGIKNERTAALDVSIFDMQGRELNTLFAVDGQYDISTYKPGMYIIKIAASSGSRYIKIIKK